MPNNEKLFEFRMGEFFEDPVYTGLWKLKDDADFNKVYLKLAALMMEFLDLEE